MLKFRHLARYFAAVLCTEECSQPSRIFQKHVQVAPCGSELFIYLKMGLQGGHWIALLEVYCQCNSCERSVEKRLRKYTNILGPSKTSCINRHVGFVDNARSWRIVFAGEQQTLPTTVMNSTNIYKYIYIYIFVDYVLYVIFRYITVNSFVW